MVHSQTYLLPTAPDIPRMRLDHTLTPSTTNELGVQGKSARQAPYRSVHSLRRRWKTRWPYPRGGPTSCRSR